MAEAKKKDVFSTLNGINVNDKTEKKNGLTYLSWAWAWGEVKKQYPDATYTVYENAAGWFYHTDGRSCWVKTGVTISGQEYIEYLPVMDHRNRSIPAEQVTSFDVNKAIQRSLTKAIARHGLGLYIYAGEDLPEDDTAAAPEPKKETKAVNLNDPIGESMGLDLANKLKEGGVKLDYALRLYGHDKLADFTWKEANNAMKHIKDILAKQNEAEAFR